MSDNTLSQTIADAAEVLQKDVGDWDVCITRSEGTWDSAARTMTFVTAGTHGEKPIRYREITQAMEEGTREYRNLVPMPNGEEFEMIRAVYRRKP